MLGATCGVRGCSIRAGASSTLAGVVAMGGGDRASAAVAAGAERAVDIVGMTEASTTDGLAIPTDGGAFAVGAVSGRGEV